MRRRAYACTCVHPRACTLVHARADVRMCVNTRANTCTRMHAHRATPTHVHVHVCTCINTCARSISVRLAPLCIPGARFTFPSSPSLSLSPPSPPCPSALSTAAPPRRALSHARPITVFVILFCFFFRQRGTRPNHVHDLFFQLAAAVILLLIAESNSIRPCGS